MNTTLVSRSALGFVMVLAAFSFVILGNAPRAGAVGSPDCQPVKPECGCGQVKNPQTKQCEFKGMEQNKNGCPCKDVTAGKTTSGKCTPAGICKADDCGIGGGCKQADGKGEQGKEQEKGKEGEQKGQEKGGEGMPKLPEPPKSEPKQQPEQKQQQSNCTSVSAFNTDPNCQGQNAQTGSSDLLNDAANTIGSLAGTQSESQANTTDPSQTGTNTWGRLAAGLQDMWSKISSPIFAGATEQTDIQAPGGSGTTGFSVPSGTDASTVVQPGVFESFSSWLRSWMSF